MLYLLFTKEESHPYMRSLQDNPWPITALLSTVMVLTLLLTACGNGGGTAIPTVQGTPRMATKQVLTFPNVGIADSAALDPALVTDSNTGLIVSMVYSGLVRLDANVQVIPDQATWDVSSDNRVYTFHLKPDLAFSDGTSLTAQTYVYSLTRALLPELQSNTAAEFEGVIVGANDVLKGKTHTLKGVKALDSQTLQITLTRPTPYFLQMLTTSVYLPVNKQLIDLYGQADWVNHVVGNGAGTGPFMIESWQHSVKMVLVPNPYYYGNKTRLTSVNMLFASDPAIAFKAYRAGRYDFAWNITQADQLAARGSTGFVRIPQLETDALFFNTHMPPFDNARVRQAFASATDKASLAHNVFQDSVFPATTIISRGMPGYQPNYTGIPYNQTLAKTLLQSVYSDVSTVPPITFAYPSSLVSGTEAVALQQMWQNVLGITVTLRAVEPTAYADEQLKHQIQLGFTQCNPDFPDPHDCLALNLLSTATNNSGQWSNADFDSTIAQADHTSGKVRISLYNQAEQIAIQDVGWLPLDHLGLAAIIPPWLHGISVNGKGLYFGDWSDVYVLQH